MNNERIKTFYAFETDEVIGIFTDWKSVEKLIKGKRNHNKKFNNYFKAMDYLCSILTEEVLILYGVKGDLKWDYPYKKAVDWTSKKN
ncbi:viroplasmin family protein [Aminipila sp.]|uniref:viroplasmin family protein n=1 Tax=Aminipila sp. TaxID=2060095 RepID=UPI00289C53A5|nr:viroplasmin family protein [Aminipila sp.]